MFVESLDGQQEEIIFRHMRQMLHDQPAGSIRILPEHIDLRRDVLAEVV